MPLMKTIEQEECVVGIWKITETFEQLCDMLHMLPRGKGVRAECAMFSSEKRKREYAAVRTLLYELTGRELTIDYFPSGRPFLRDEKTSISISHTVGYAAVILSATHNVGIDIEAVSRKILNLKKYFISDKERADTLYELLLHWSGKEVAFKLIDQEGIDFCKHLLVKNLSCFASEEHPTTNGSFLTEFHLKTNEFGNILMKYETTPSYVLVYSFTHKNEKENSEK